MVGVVLPLVVLVAGFFLVALVSAVAVFMVVAIIVVITNSVRRLLHGPRDDGRRNVKIVVHSARVMDPLIRFQSRGRSLIAGASLAALERFCCVGC